MAQEHNRNKISSRWILGSVGTLALIGSAELVRRQLDAVPHELQDERVTQFKRGAVILTAGALALEAGASLTLMEIQQLTDLNRHNTSWGVNFLIEKQLAMKESKVGRDADHVAATLPLLAAAGSPEYRLLHDAMQQIAARQG